MGVLTTNLLSDARGVSGEGSTCRERGWVCCKELPGMRGENKDALEAWLCAPAESTDAMDGFLECADIAELSEADLLI